MDPPSSTSSGPPSVVPSEPALPPPTLPSLPSQPPPQHPEEARNCTVPRTTTPTTSTTLPVNSVITDRDDEVDDGGMMFLECSKCMLRFDSKKALVVHNERFCGRLEEVILGQDGSCINGGTSHNKGRVAKAYMTFEEVKRYLESQGTEDVDVGTTSLEDIRKSIQSSDYEMQMLKAQLQKKRAEQKAEEIRKLKVKQQQARAKKYQDNADLEELIQIELQHKQKELQAGLEREKISRELKKVKDRQLNELQDEKKRSLAMLQTEKETLSKREQEMLEAIHSLETKIIERDRQLEMEAVALEEAPVKDLDEKSKALREKHMELAKAHGVKLATLTQNSKQLVDEQQRVTQEWETIKKKKGGDGHENGLDTGDDDALSAMVQKLCSEPGIKEQEGRVMSLKEASSKVELSSGLAILPSSTTGTEANQTDEIKALREQELKALSSTSPTKLPLAQDAERMLDQWLKSDNESCVGQTSLGRIMSAYPADGTKQPPPPPTIDPPKPTNPPIPAQSAASVPRPAIATNGPNIEGSGSGAISTGNNIGKGVTSYTSRNRRVSGHEDSPARGSGRDIPHLVLRGGHHNNTNEDESSDRNHDSEGPKSSRSARNRGGGGNAGTPKRVAAPPKPESHKNKEEGSSTSTNVTKHDGGDDKARFLKDLKGLRRRYQETGGGNTAILQKMEQLESEMVREAGGNTAAAASTALPSGTPANSGAGSNGPPGSMMGPGTYPPPPMGYANAMPYYSNMYNPASTAPQAWGDYTNASNSFFPNPYFNAMSVNPQQQLWQAYQQLLSLDAENSRMQDDLDLGVSGVNMPSLRPSDSFMDGPTPRLDSRDGTHGIKKSSSTQDALIRTLTSLPPDHKLHKLWESHLEEVASLQLEVERMQKLSELETLKATITREKEKQRKQQLHEDMLEEQRRTAQTVRLQRTLGITSADALTSRREAAPPVISRAGPYDPDDGLLVLVDFVLGLPDKLQAGPEAKKARLVYAMYEGSKAFGSVKSSSWIDCQRLSKPNVYACTFSLRLTFSYIPILKDLMLISEVDIGEETVATSKPPKSQSAGWGYIPLFNEESLARGYHKMKMYSGAFSPSALDAVLKGNTSLPPGRRPTLNGVCLYLRVFAGQDNIPDLDLHEPAEVEDMFLTPRASLPPSATTNPLISIRDIRDDPQLSLAAPLKAEPAAAMPITPSTGQQPAANDPFRLLSVATKPPASSDIKPAATATQAAGGEQAPSFSAVRRTSLDKRVVKPPSPASTAGTEEVSSQTASANPLSGRQSAGRPSSRTSSAMDKKPSSPTQQRQQPPLNQASGLTRRRSSLGQSSTGSGERRMSRLASSTLKRTDTSIFLNTADALQPTREENDDDESDNKADGFAASLSDAPLLQESPPPPPKPAPGDEMFLPYRRERPDVKPETYQKGDGVNFYIDGARGLPDNAIITRVTVRVMSSQGKQLGPEHVSYCDAESTRAAPHFNLFCELRDDAFDPTMTVLARIDTVEKGSKKVVCVGYAVLNLFMLPDNPSVQPSSEKTQEFSLNQGAFQVPLHWGPPSLKSGSFNTDSLNQIGKVPCATLLCRILPAPKTEDGLAVLNKDDVPPEEWKSLGVVVAAPEYSTGGYDNSRCIPSTIEQSIYQRRVKADSCHNQSVRAAILEALDSNGPSGGNNAINEWITAKFKDTKPTELLDFTYILRYQQDVGFKVSIDSLCNLPSPGMFGTPKLYKVVFCLCPPGLYYHAPPLTEDAHFATQYDLESSCTAPKFKDGFQTFRDVRLDPALNLLIEVRSIKYEKDKIVVDPAEEGYWTALPIFKDSAYVNTGDFQLPLVKGKVPSEVITCPNIQAYIKDKLQPNLAKSKSPIKGLEMSEGVSVSVRLVDGLLESECLEPATWTANSANTKKSAYIDNLCQSANANRFMFEPKAPSDKNLRRLVPKKMTAGNYFKDVNKKFAEVTNITHYTF